MNTRLDCEQVEDWLVAYSAGNLEPAPTLLLHQHLNTCPLCQLRLAGWRNLAQATRLGATEQRHPFTASERILAGVLSRIETEQFAPEPRVLNAYPRFLVRKLSQLVQIVLSQLGLIRRSIWLASALIMGLGSGVALALKSEQASGILLAILAPLVAAIGVAFIYGPENDPALELALATPISPRLILLARLMVVFGYDLVLTLGVTLLLTLVSGGQFLLWSLILLWLGPMLFLASLSLVLSLLVNSGMAVAIVMLLWTLRLLSLTGLNTAELPVNLGQLFNSWSQTSLIMVAISIGLAGVALVYGPRHLRMA